MAWRRLAQTVGADAAEVIITHDKIFPNEERNIIPKSAGPCLVTKAYGNHIKNITPAYFNAAQQTDGVMVHCSLLQFRTAFGCTLQSAPPRCVLAKPGAAVGRGKHGQVSKLLARCPPEAC